MATNRDVKMTLSVDTLGEDGIKSLQKSIQTLASEGGDAAPEFQKLADEVGRLGEQSKALAAFKELGTVTEALTTKQAEATQTSANLSAKLDTLKTATQEAKAKQQEAAAALAAGQVATQEAAGALRLLKADYDNAGKQTEEFRTKQKGLIEAQTSAGIAIVALRTAQREANAELAAAEAAQKKAEGAYTRSEKAIASTTEALTRQEAVVKEAAAATEKLGLSATDVATSEGVLLAALNKVGSEAAQHSAAIKEMAESDRLLAIEEKGLAELFARGANALQAETLAQRDADRSNAEYAASLAKVNAEKARSVDTAAQWQREAEAIVNAAESAQKLERDTIALLKAEQQLASNNAFAQQLEDAKKLNQAADYVQFWTTELDRADAAAKQLQGAFNALNVRSAEAIRADITAVRSALETVKAQAASTGQTMSGAFDAGKAKIAALELEMRQLNGTMTLGDKAAGVLSNSLGQISAGNIVADGVGYLVNKVKELGRAFLDAVVQGDQMRRGLNAVYKDTEITAKQIEFLRKTTSESGVSLGALSSEFVRFSASMNSANVPMAESNALFRAVTAASASLGLGAEATSGALNALGQMASKGTVSMEELRQQLGDRLPGALGLAAKGMGITEAQLIALVSSGGLATRDFIVPFTKALETMRGETDGLVPSWGRLQTAFSTTAQSMGEAGGVQLLIGVLKVLGGLLGTVTLGFSVLFEMVMGGAKAFGILAASALTLTNPLTDLKNLFTTSADRLALQNQQLNNFIDGTDNAASATTAHAAALTANTAEITKSIAANAELSAEQKLTALSTALAGDKTLDASAKMVQYNVAAAELIAKQTLQTESYGKLAKAAKEEGDTLVAMAKLTGDVNAVQTAGVQAAEMHATALEKLAVSQASELRMLEAQKAEIIENSKGIEGGTAARQGLIDKIDALIVKSKAETEQSVQASIAAKQQVLERALLSQATLDHSGAVDTLKLAVDAAAAELAKYELAAKTSLFMEETVKVKRHELTVVTALYRDALADTVRAIEAKAAVSKSDLAISQTLIGIQIAQSKAAQELAIANKDYATATAEAVKQIKLQADLGAAQLAEQKAQLKNTIELNVAKLEEAKASGTLTSAMQAELEASIKLAQAKLKEADATKKSGEQQTIAADISKTSADATKTLSDASAGLKDGISAETQAKIDNAQAGLDSAQVAYESAKASGDELGAAEALVKVKEAELKVAEILAEAKREEAATARKLADAKKAEAQAAIETANAIAREIAAADVVTEAMKKQAAEAKVNATAKAGAAKEAYAHADALDVEAKGAEKAVGTAQRALDASRRSLDQMRHAAAQATAEVNGLAKAFDPMAAINARVAELVTNLAEAGNTAWDLKQASATASESVARVGEQNLSTLRSAIDSATQKMQSLSDAAKTALTSVQDELDQLNANYDDIERRKYEAKLDELQALLDQARAEGNTSAAADLQRTIELTKKLYEGYKIPDAVRKEVEDGNLDSSGSNTGTQEQREAEQKAAERQRNIDAAKAAADAVEGKTKSTGIGQPAGSSNKTVTVVINGRSQSVNVASDADATALTSVLRSLETAANTAS